MDRKKKGKKQNNQQKETIQRHRTRFAELPVPQVHEPEPPCAICNQSISLIAEAITEPDGRYSHFDCVVEKLKEQEHVTENEKISYIGHGSFAVFVKDEEGRYIIKTRIPYESKESYEAVKKFVEGTKE